MEDFRECAEGGHPMPGVQLYVDWLPEDVGFEKTNEVFVFGWHGDLVLYSKNSGWLLYRFMLDRFPPHTWAELRDLFPHDPGVYLADEADVLVDQAMVVIAKFAVLLADGVEGREGLIEFG